MKNRVVCIVLAFLVGGFGAHKFYLGRKKSGWWYLLFFWTGIPFLMAWHFACQLIFASDEEFDEVFNKGNENKKSIFSWKGIGLLIAFLIVLAAIGDSGNDRSSLENGEGSIGLDSQVTEVNTKVESKSQEEIQREKISSTINTIYGKTRSEITNMLGDPRWDFEATPEQNELGIYSDVSWELHGDYKIEGENIVSWEDPITSFALVNAGDGKFPKKLENALGLDLLSENIPFYINKGMKGVMSISIGDEATKRQNEANKKELIEKQFRFNGSHKLLTLLIQETMNDPDSYKHIRTKYIDEGDTILVSSEFSGSNAFGGTVRNTINARFTIDGEFVELVE